MRESLQVIYLTSDNLQEVYFDQYCKNCKHSSKKEDEDPCYDCLKNPYNLESHKPVYFKERRGKKK